jgi:hypothetical protein
MTKYKIKGRRGIDDLQGIYAFIGNSQGDTSGTNDIEVYKASGGWMSFVFNCELTQEAINKESERIIEANSKYISQLIKEEKYGEEYESILSIEPNPLFDYINTDKPTISHSFTILDFNK